MYRSRSFNDCLRHCMCIWFVGKILHAGSLSGFRQADLIMCPLLEENYTNEWLTFCWRHSWRVKTVLNCRPLTMLKFKQLFHPLHLVLIHPKMLQLLKMNSLLGLRLPQQEVTFQVKGLCLYFIRNHEVPSMYIVHHTWYCMSNNSNKNLKT